MKNKCTLSYLCESYQRGDKFRKLKGSTQKDYSNNLRIACDTPVNSKVLLGELLADDISTKILTEAYDKWSIKGVRTANYIRSCLSIVYRQAQIKELVYHNPVALLKTEATKPRKNKWTKEQVKAFLDVAYTNYRWRSIGLIVHMSYEWAQRVGDIRLLKWDNICLSKGRIDLTQSKKGADVHLPITKNLVRMLREQKEWQVEEMGDIPYVAPRTKPRTGAYTPYDKKEIKTLVNEVKQKANLPKNITAMDLRRTAITELVEEGVDITGIMQVSGHKNPQSVKPYLVNTYSGASQALSSRFGDEYD